ncbi:MAG: hypothetical protein IPO90_03545 [Flavobacteriales bacterium]|nr:hypothetical protein [Flavobacteriales bacterium]
MVTTRHLLLFGLLALLLLGCRKDEMISDDPGAKLVLAEDTVLFDTVFTTIGSVTKRFTVRNENTNAVSVDIALEGGTPSPFRINVDGASGTTFNDVEILGGDSIFIFVEATLGENNSNDPFIIEDHILLNTNGNLQEVLLLAWGQDAYFHKPTPGSLLGILPCDAHWFSDKPHVIYGIAAVDSACTLTIDPGVKVYVHGGGRLWIYRDGQILANGTVTEPIVFQGDRLEPFYDDLPNQWDRIWINEGRSGSDNLLTNVVIKNALIGLQVQSYWTAGQPLSENTLILQNVNIKNCSTAGLYAENYRIKATNLLVGDAGQYSVVLTGGGKYEFDHATVGNYWSFEIRQDPAFLLTNRFIDRSGAGQVRPIETSTFTNGIIYGSNANEFQLDLDAAQTSTLEFRNYLFRTDQLTNDPVIFPDQNTIYRNQNPGFVDASEGDLHLICGANAKNKASTPSLDALQDLDGEPRPSPSDCDGVFEPDLGCYEQHGD